MERVYYSRRVPQMLLRFEAEQLINILNSSQKIHSNAQLIQYHKIKEQVQLILQKSNMSTDNEDDLEIRHIRRVFMCSICNNKFQLLEDAVKNCESCLKNGHISKAIRKQLQKSQENASRALVVINAMAEVDVKDLANEQISNKNEIETNVDQQVEQFEIVVDNIPDNMDDMQNTVKEERSDIELATHGNENKTIIRIEVDNFTHSMFNAKALGKCIGKDNKEDFEQMKNQIIEILFTSPTVKVCVETYPNQMVDNNNYCGRLEKSTNLVNHIKVPKKVGKKVKNEVPEHVTLTLNKATRKFLTKDYSSYIQSLLQRADNMKYGKYIGTIEKAITAFIQRIFPDKSVDIYCFGSRLSGIATAQSDLDIYIDIGHTLHNFEEFPSTMTLDKLRTVQRAMRKSCKDGDDLDNSEALKKMRIPTLRVQHSLSRIHCKLYFSNIMGMTNTILFNYLFELQPIARAMCMYLKEWMQRALKNIDVNTYSLCLMVVFYLQSLNILPSIRKLQQNLDHEDAVMVGPWVCSYVPLGLEELDMIRVDSVYENCLELVRAFFDFYIHFNYKSEVICPYWGRSLNKAELNSFMPYWYLSYVANSSFDLDLNSPITLQDPIQLNHNVMENLTLNHFLTFKNVMYESFDLMCRTPK